MSTATPGSGPHPLVGRQRHLVLALRLSLVASLLAAAGAVALPGDLGAALAVVLVGLLIAVPLGRVLWLTIRWIRRRDRRFALVGTALLTVVVLAAASAL
jgi:hypothetical protein